MDSLPDYAELHVHTHGPDDARPTALKIIRDEALDGRLNDRVALITGCVSGIGRETARALNATGIRLLLCGRDISALEVVRSDLLRENDQAEISVIEVDLSSLQSVERATAEVRGLVSRLDILICNAGATMMPESESAEGFEYHFATNFVSHFLLFDTLRPLMLGTSSPEYSSRVVLVSSAGHRYSPVMFEQDFKPSPFDASVAYGQSKTALIYMATEIQRRYGHQGISAFAVHPGGVKNSMYDRLDPGIAAYMIRKYWTRMKSPAQGAATSVWAAVSRAALASGGRYLEDCGEARPVAEGYDDLSPGFAIWAYDAEASQRLWTIMSEKLSMHRQL